jgi:hypothetical protein
MAMPRWEALGRVSPSRLAETRLVSHHAAQMAAAVGRSLVPARPDDGHTSLAWDPALGGLAGQAVAGEHPWRAGLLLRDLSLAVIVEGQPVQRLGLGGQTVERGRTWLREKAKEHGSPGGRLSFDTPYVMPHHSVDAGEPFSVPADGSLAEVARWFADADLVLRQVAERWPGAALVRVWPHHFDVGSVLPLGEDGDEDAPSIGIGLSPGDEGLEEPYFYVTPWPPLADEEALPPLTAPGRWHREGWAGAVLAGTDVVAAGDGEAQSVRASAFLAEAVSVLRGHRGRRS